MKKALLPALLASLLIQNGSALASSSATATVDWSSLNVQLVDQSGGLDAPVFAWAASRMVNLSATAETRPDAAVYDSEFSPDLNTGFALSKSVFTPKAQASAIINDAIQSTEAASQPGTVPLGYGEGANVGLGYTYVGPNFSIQGKGIAIITLNWSLSVSGTQGDFTDLADASIDIHGLFSDNLSPYVDVHSGYSTSSAYHGDASYSGTFVMTVSNAGGIHYGSLDASVNVIAGSFTVPVPEPETYSMLLAGLGMLGLTLRRRKV